MRKNLPDHCRGYIYCYLKITDNNMTVLYPTPLLTKELSTTPNQPLGSNMADLVRHTHTSLAKSSILVKSIILYNK